MAGVVSHAIVEERRRTTHMDGYRNSSSLAVLRQYRLNLLLNDLLNIEFLRSRRTGSQQNPGHSRNDDVFSNHGGESRFIAVKVEPHFRPSCLARRSLAGGG